MELLHGFANLAGLVSLGISLALCIAAVFSIVHAARTPEDAFRAANKWQKNYWLIALVACALLSFIQVFGMAIAAVGVLVYLLDVRPKVDEVRRPRY